MTATAWSVLLAMVVLSTAEEICRRGDKDQERPLSRETKPAPASVDELGGWQYLLIPEGTVIPSGLIVTRDHVMRIRGRSCWHYSISPNYSMPVSQYLLRLDQLAANAKIDLKRASHG